MSLIFSCISAHTPLLMPTIAKENITLLDKTRNALAQLEQALYIAQPETLVVISPHGDALPDAVTINLNSKYISNFEEFGDLVTKIEWKPDTMLIDRIRENFKEKHLPLVLSSSDKFDYGTAVPLYYLTQHMPQVKVIPVQTSSGLDVKTHYNIGKELKDEIMSSTRRVAVIASADMSHRVGESSPAGFSPKGVEFDEKIVELITKNKPLGILDIDTTTLTEAQACSAQVLGMMFGVMDDVSNVATLLSYEKPFGVGYLIAEMKIA